VPIIRKKTFYSIAAFLLGLGIYIKINLFGTLIFSEIFAVILILPLIILEGSFDRRLFTPILFVAIWMLGNLIGDYYNHSSMSNILKGVAGPFFVGACLVAMFYLIKHSEHALKLFFLGYWFSTIYLLIENPSREYRMGLNFLFTVSAMVVSIYIPFFYKHKNRLIFINLLLGGIVFVTGGRSPTLIYIGASFIIFYGNWLYQNKKKFNFFSVNSLLLIGAGLLLLFIFQTGYKIAISQNVFPEEYQKKYEGQLEASDGSVILGGRKEWTVAIAAISDAPILGHGTWAKDYKYRAMLFDGSGQDYRNQPHLMKNILERRIPAHSFVNQAWIENGIIAALFMIYFLFNLFRWFATFINKYNHFLFYVFAMVFVTYLWDFFFSPFGLNRRFWVGFIIALSIFYNEKTKVKKKA
jgi:hypothetical protein